VDIAELDRESAELLPDRQALGCWTWHHCQPVHHCWQSWQGWNCNSWQPWGGGCN
jgi:hypothetical protein